MITVIALFLPLLNQNFALPIGGSSTAILTPFNNAVDISAQKIEQSIGSKAYVNNFPDSGRTKAVHEQEDLLSKKDTAYGRLHEFVATFYNPKPIVDTIEEHEKYGNDGEKYRAIGTAIVGGIEGFSNLLNAAVEVPFEAAKQLGRKITTSLNTVGGKLVGLA